MSTRKSNASANDKRGCFTLLRKVGMGHYGALWRVRCECGATSIRFVAQLTRTRTCRDCPVRSGEISKRWAERRLARLLAGDSIRRYGSLPDPDPPSETFEVDPECIGQWSDSASISPSNTFDREEARHLLRRALLDCGPGETFVLHPREAVILRMLFGLDSDEELTLDDVAQIFGLSRSTIYGIVQRAMSRLRRSGYCIDYYLAFLDA